MNFKRIGRALICLLLVCCLIVSISPIKAKALVPESLMVGAGIVIASALVGLGLGMASDSTADFLVDYVEDCSDFITLNYDFITDDDKVQVWATANPDLPYVLDQNFIEAVRQWAFESGTVTETETFTTRTYYCTALGSSSSSRPSSVLNSLVKSYPQQTLSLLQSLGVNKDVAILCLNKTSPVELIGVFFDNTGVMNVGRFESSFSSYNYSQLGVYSLSDLSLIECEPIRTYSGSYSYSAPVYYSTSYADTYYSGGSTAYALCFLEYPGGSEFCFYRRNFSGSATWDSSYSYLGFYFTSSMRDSGYGPDIDTITWDNNAVTLISVASGFVANEIAPSSVALTDAYPNWHGKSITIPQEDGKPVVVGWPAGIGSTLDDTWKLTQADVWNGVSTYGGGGDLENPDDGSGDNDNTGGLTLGDVTVTAFIGKLLADLTRGLLGDGPKTLTELLGSLWLELQTELRQMLSSITQSLTDIGTYIKSLPDAFSGWFADILSSIKSLPDAFSDWFADISSNIKSLSQSFSELFTQNLEALQTHFNELSKTLTSLLEGLKTELLQGIKDFFLPKEGYMDAKVDALTSKYEFANSIASTGDKLKFFFDNLGQQPPIIYIDLSATRGSYDIGGKTVLMDLTWYSEYKPTVDTIISAFLYLWLAWRMLLSLPGIIQGTSGFWNKQDSTAGAGTWERPAARLNPGEDVKLLGTSNYHSPGTRGRHYIKHD